MDRLLLRKAIGRASNKLVSFEESGIFSYIYPFTTENIAGYIEKFDLEKKKLLTVGSSGDQIINASIKGCEDQTIVDICPFTKGYFYLKKAALIALEYEEFSDFFCYLDYPKVFKTNKKAFNRTSLNKIFTVLKQLDYESFEFWNELINRVDPYNVRLNMFSQDEDRYEVLTQANLYLRNEESYNRAKKIIERIEPKFITENIYNLKLKEQYDNIFLSNLAQYYSLEDHKKLLDKLSLHLTEEGKILISYLYATAKDNTDENERGIYNRDKALEVLGAYITTIEDFTGMKGLKFKEEGIKDSVMIYQKK